MKFSWQQSNARQLGDGLAALRQRLENFIQRQNSPGPATTPPPSAPAPAAAKTEEPLTAPATRDAGRKTVSRSLFQRLLGGAGAGPSVPPANPPAEEPGAGKGPPASEAKAELTEPPSALALLGQRLGLSLFEQNVLLLCAAM